MRVQGECEAGVYLDVNGGIVFLSWKDIGMDEKIKNVKESFKREWPQKWEEIKASISEGPFSFRDSPYPDGSRLVEDPGDLYLLTKLDLLLVPGIREASAEKLLIEIGKSKERPLHKIIKSLGIRHIEEGNSRLLAKTYSGIDELGRASWEDISNIPGFGPTMTYSVVDFFHTESSWRNIEKMRLGGVELSPIGESKKESSLVVGKTFMFTGRLFSMTRNEAQSRLEGKGGFAGASVNKGTDYLVVGDKPGSKLVQASTLGIKVITEEEFQTMLGDNS